MDRDLIVTVKGTQTTTNFGCKCSYWHCTDIPENNINLLIFALYPLDSHTYKFPLMPNLGWQEWVKNLNSIDLSSNSKCLKTSNIKLLATLWNSIASSAWGKNSIAMIIPKLSENQGDMSNLIRIISFAFFLYKKVFSFFFNFPVKGISLNFNYQVTLISSLSCNTF